ncbi:MAG: tRNA lysidine(34) synthetase TilS, partial [Bdellovibrionales bacterium]|nr:tRNA lysidine(34) synthetase TilS [Bdellovibrionales bacterium]
ADAAREFFDLDAIFSGLNASKDETALVVRERRDGDVVRVASRGSRKLKKLFQEQGVMLTLRDRIPIVELDSRILWVPGVARSEVAPVGSETRNLLVLEYRQLGPSQAGAFL